MIALEDGDVDGCVFCRMQVHIPIAFERGFEAEVTDVEVCDSSDFAGLNNGIELGAFHGFHRLLKKNIQGVCMQEKTPGQTNQARTEATRKALMRASRALFACRYRYARDRKSDSGDAGCALSSCSSQSGSFC